VSFSSLSDLVITLTFSEINRLIQFYLNNRQIFTTEFTHYATLAHNTEIVIVTTK